MTDDVARETIPLVIVLGVSVLARVIWRNVFEYSRADETVMLLHAWAVLRPGFSYLAYCRRWLRNRVEWATPGPVRYGNMYLIAGAFLLTGRREHGTMAWVSTLAGCLQVALVYAIGDELRGPTVGLWAAALAATSPLGLAMGRRALQDAAISATALGAVWALLAGHHAAGAVALGFLLAQKETALLLYPAVATAVYVAGRGVWWPFVAGPALYVAGFAALARGRVWLLWDFARAVSSQGGGSVGRHPYSVRYQSGPLHRLPVDLFILGPVACVMAARSGAWAPLLGAAALVLILGILPGVQNVRIALAADGLLRVAAGAVLAVMAPVLSIPLLLASAAAELWIFNRIFLQAGVYDPVTENLVTAVGICPGAKFDGAPPAARQLRRVA